MNIENWSQHFSITDLHDKIRTLVYLKDKESIARVSSETVRIN